MDLKDYQQQALETLERYLEALKDAYKKADELSALRTCFKSHLIRFRIK